MKRVLIIIGLILLLTTLFRDANFRQFWDKFWEIPHEKPAGWVALQNFLANNLRSQPVIPEDQDKPQQKKHASRTPAAYNQRIKVKLDKVPFGGIYGETKFDFILR